MFHLGQIQVLWPEACNNHGVSFKGKEHKIVNTKLGTGHWKGVPEASAPLLVGAFVNSSRQGSGLWGYNHE